MNLTKFLISVLFAAIFCCTVTAQDSVDSTTTDEQVNSYEDTTESYSQDIYTFGLQSESELLLNENTIASDSVRAIKNEREFAYADKLDSVLKKLKSEEEKKELAYKDKPFKRSWLEELFLSSVVKWMFAILAIIFVLIIVYKLFFAKGVFLRSSYSRNVSEVGENVTDIAPDDFDALIANALAAKNFRLTVRYLFKKTLQLLADKNHLIIGADKTNYQYVHELRSANIKNDFSALVMYYEYVWYGEIEIDENIFSEIQNKFLTFNNQL